MRLASESVIDLTGIAYDRSQLRGGGRLALGVRKTFSLVCELVINYCGPAGQPAFRNRRYDARGASAIIQFRAENFATLCGPRASSSSKRLHHATGAFIPKTAASSHPHAMRLSVYTKLRSEVSRRVPDPT